MCQAIREIRKEAREEGIKIGIMQLLGEKGNVPEVVQEKIEAQRSMDTLRVWLGLSAKAESVESFMQVTGLDLD